MLKNFFSFIKELVKIVVISLVIIIPVRQFLIQPFYVKGASMEPNFHDHEYLIVNEITYQFNDPQRGDIVVFRYPREPKEFYIKRVIGLPGEKVQIQDGSVFIYNEKNPNGIAVSEPYLAEGTRTYGMNESDMVTLGEDEYYVMGDNRNSSKDSRSFGPVGRSFIIGKVLFRGWPFDKISVFKDNPAYNF